MLRFRTRIAGPRGRWRLPPLAVVAVVVLAASLVAGERALRPTAWALAEARASVLATEAVNRAVETVVADGVRYQDLIHVEKDEQGRVTLLQPDALQVSRLAARATLAVQEELKRMSGLRFSIPLGQALGTNLFASFGPGIPVTVYPLGTARVGVSDRFESAGINQTRHTIFLDVEATLRVMIPLLRREVRVTARAPVVDVVIVGQVPLGYLHLDPTTPR
ncbi:MAG: sporulation protein YunB [Acetobacteraceae bacterium]|nr:sporulation protein YunB [Acetobacteraceae bacterium]